MRTSNKTEKNIRNARLNSLPFLTAPFHALPPPPHSTRTRVSPRANKAAAEEAEVTTRSGEQMQASPYHPFLPSFPPFPLPRPLPRKTTHALPHAVTHSSPRLLITLPPPSLSPFPLPPTISPLSPFPLSLNYRTINFRSLIPASLTALPENPLVGTYSSLLP